MSEVLFPKHRTNWDSLRCGQELHMECHFEITWSIENFQLCLVVSFVGIVIYFIRF